jgi:hypothetical protein
MLPAGAAPLGSDDNGKRGKAPRLLTLILLGVGVLLMLMWLASLEESSGALRFWADDQAAQEPGTTGVVVGTRYWGNSQANLELLQDFLTRALRYCDKVLVAVRVEEDKTDGLRFLKALNDPRIVAFAVEPWGYVTPALNALVIKAAQLNASYILFHSLEVMATPKHVKRLLQHVRDDPQTFIAGGALPGAHRFMNAADGGGGGGGGGSVATTAAARGGAMPSPMELPIDGLNTPWNTFSLWHLGTLALVGFQTVSDGLAPGVRPETEEVVTISLLQRLARRDCSDGAGFCRHKAKLVQMDERLTWRLPFMDGEQPLDEYGQWRRRRHVKKMETKVPYSDEQLRALGIERGRIIHVPLDA